MLDTDLPATATIGDTLTITWKDGTAPYAIDVLFNGAVLSSDVVATAKTYSFNTTGHAAGTYAIRVTDANQYTITSRNSNVTVAAAPLAFDGAQPTTGKIGDINGTTVTFKGGNPSPNYTGSIIEPDGVSGHDNEDLGTSLTYTANTPEWSLPIGNWSISITDHSARAAISTSVAMSYASPVGLYIDPASPVTGATVNTWNSGTQTLNLVYGGDRVIQTRRGDYPNLSNPTAGSGCTWGTPPYDTATFLGTYEDATVKIVQSGAQATFTPKAIGQTTVVIRSGGLDVVSTIIINVTAPVPWLHPTSPIQKSPNVGTYGTIVPSTATYPFTVTTDDIAVGASMTLGWNRDTTLVTDRPDGVWSVSDPAVISLGSASTPDRQAINYLSVGTCTVTFTPNNTAFIPVKFVITYNQAMSAPSFTSDLSSPTTATTGVPFTTNTVAAKGNPTPTYAWSSADGSSGGTWTTIPGGTGTSMSVASPVAGTKRYKVVATNSVGSVESNTLTVVTTTPPAAPIITSQPTAAPVTAPTPFHISVIATGQDGHDLDYHWFETTSNSAGVAVGAHDGASSWDSAATTPGNRKFFVNVTDKINGLVTKSDEATVVINAPAVVPVTSVTLSPKPVSLAPTATQQLTATVAPSTATNKAVSYSSSATGVATVSTTGLITAVANGTATITVTTTDQSKTDTCVVTVSTPVTSMGTVTLSPASPVIAGTSTTASGSVVPASATNQAKTWSVSASTPTVATINGSTGVVTTLVATETPTTVTITATTADGAKTNTASLLVNPATSTTPILDAASPVDKLNVAITQTATVTCTVTNLASLTGTVTYKWQRSIASPFTTFTDVAATGDGTGQGTATYTTPAIILSLDQRYRCIVTHKETNKLISPTATSRVARITQLAV